MSMGKIDTSFAPARLVVPDESIASGFMKLGRAEWAAQEISKFDRATVNRIATAVAQVAHDNAGFYAEWAVRETGYGVVEHKQLKNELVAFPLLDYYRDTDLVTPRIDHEKKIVEIPKPAGIVLALTPATNPISTVYFKVLLAILSRNAIVISPHPAAKLCSNDAAAKLEAAATAAGAPPGLIQCIEQPTVPLVNELMKSPKVAVILATGGGAMVRAAYSSGTPALGVGPGNAPVYVDSSADLHQAAKMIVDSKSFDNSVLCTNESVLLTLDRDRQRFERELRAASAYLCSAEEVVRLRDYLFPGGNLNLAAIGKSAAWIAREAGIRVVTSAKILVAPVEQIGIGEPLTKEKLCPVLAMHSVDTFERGLRAAQMVLRLGGAGHSAAFHGEDSERALAFASGLNVYRVVVNAPCSQGAAGFATHLPPTFTIGTGYFGKSSLGENAGPQHLVHWTRLAYRKDAALSSDAFRSESLNGHLMGSARAPANRETSALSPAVTASPSSDIDRETLRQLISQELRNLTRGRP
jgi:acyl-CoA reductase-like NAD-dependent aldehyde dehydrogenase